MRPNDNFIVIYVSGRNSIVHYFSSVCFYIMLTINKLIIIIVTKKKKKLIIIKSMTNVISISGISVLQYTNSFSPFIRKIVLIQITNDQYFSYRVKINQTCTGVQTPLLRYRWIPSLSFKIFCGMIKLIISISLLNQNLFMVYSQIIYTFLYDVTCKVAKVSVHIKTN